AFIMRIFYVCYENLSLQRAPTTHVKEITEHLKKSGNAVILFAPNTGRLKGKTDVRVVYVPTLNVRFISEYVYYLSLFFYLLAYHAKFKADVIYLREMGLSVAPALIGFIFRIPGILEINGIPSVDLKSAGTHRLRRKIYWAFQHLNVLLADKVICVSENIKRALDSINKNTQKVVIIENGVNKDLFCPQDKIAARRLLSLEPDCYYLLL
ncbi:MAG: glycosyltransferase, partial [Planctomycetota bacterium]